MIKRFIFLSLVAKLAVASMFSITNVKEDTITINTRAQVGASAVVLRTISNEHKAIIAKATVIDVQDSTTTLKVAPFTALHQDALPRYEGSVRIDDTVYLGWLHERVLLVAPNVSTYKAITQSSRDKTYVHSDLFAAFLSKQGHVSPTQEDFRQFCQSYDIGLVQFSIDSKLFHVDCNSFEIVGTTEDAVPTSQVVQAPFYSRVQKISANWWGKGTTPIKEYSMYYQKLLGVMP